jgi:hypothetical protein
VTRYLRVGLMFVTLLGGDLAARGDQSLLCFGIGGAFTSLCTTLPDGVRITFNPDATNAGLNVGSVAGAPSSLSNGDVWYDSTAAKFKCRQNGATTDCIGTGSGGPSTPGTTTDNAIVRWDGTGGTAIQNSGIAIDDSNVIAFPDGVKQTFNPDGTNAGFNVGSQAGDPSTLGNGDCWYNSSTNEFKCRINGTSVALGGSSGNPRVCVFATGDDSDSDNTLHDDPTLLFSLDANATYDVVVKLIFNSGTSNTPDGSAKFTLPTGATFTYSEKALTLAATATTNVFYTAAPSESSPTSLLQFGVLTSATSLSTPWEVVGTVVTAGTSGTFQTQWAQNTTTGGTPTVRKAGSSVCYQKF